MMRVRCLCCAQLLEQFLFCYHYLLIIPEIRMESSGGNTSHRNEIICDFFKQAIYGYSSYMVNSAGQKCIRVSNARKYHIHEHLQNNVGLYVSTDFTR